MLDAPPFRTLLLGPVRRGLGGLIGLLLLSVAAAPSLQAQSLEVGLQSGASFSTFRGNTAVVRRGTFYDVQWRTDAQVAGFVGIPLNDVIRLRPELRYLRKGANVEGSRAFSPSGGGEQVPLQETYRFSYLQLPVLLEARLPVTNRLQASVLLGPGVGLTVGTDIAEDPNSQTETIPESAVRDWDLTAITGLEAGYTLGSRGRLLLGANYGLGLSALTSNDDAAVEQGKEADIQSDAITVSLGYAYSF
jgi:hypothetical protein